MVYARIIGTGSCLPERIVANEELAGKKYYRNDGKTIAVTSDQIFNVTGIRRRRWASKDETSIDLAERAARSCISEAAGFGEAHEPNLILFAHNAKFGDGVYTPIPPVSALLQYSMGLSCPGFDIITSPENPGLEAKLHKALSSHYNNPAVLDGDLSHARTLEEVKHSHYNINDKADLLVYNHHSALGPSRASLLADRLGLAADALDVVMGCPGSVAALTLGNLFIRSRLYRDVLVVGSEKLRDITDDDHIDSTLYADGAGAVRLAPSYKEGILDFELMTIGEKWSLLCLAERPNGNGGLCLRMEGREIHKLVIDVVPSIINRLLGKNGLSLADIDEIYIHQMNGRTLTKVAEKLYNVDETEAKRYMGRFMPLMVQDMGNNSVAAPLIVMDHSRRGILHKSSETILENADGSSSCYKIIASVGAGLNAAAALYGPTPLSLRTLPQHR